MMIREALQQVDPMNDAQWTSDGLPLVDVVRELTGNELLTRKEITDADPGFCREEAQQSLLPAVLKRERALHMVLIGAYRFIANPLDQIRVLRQLKLVVLTRKCYTDEERQSRQAENDLIACELHRVRNKVLRKVAQ